jgi:heat shock protein HslJ
MTTLTVPELVGSAWQLRSYMNRAGTVVSVLSATQPTATYSADGQVTGCGGCDMFGGPFQSTAATLSIATFASTCMACDEPVMDKEADYFAGLQMYSTYRLEHSRLELFDDSGATLMVFDPSVEL